MLVHVSEVVCLLRKLRLSAGSFLLFQACNISACVSGCVASQAIQLVLFVKLYSSS